MRLTRAKTAVLAITCATAIRACSSAHVMEPEPPRTEPPSIPGPRESPPAPGSPSEDEHPDAGPSKERPGPHDPMRDSLQTRLARNP